MDYHAGMELYNKLYNAVSPASKKVKIDLIHIGISYIAVITSDGGSGISFTFLRESKSCTAVKDPMDYEGKTAEKALDLLFSDSIVERSVAVALINALNYKRADSMPADNGTLFRDLGLSKGSKVSMVGFFGPVLKRLKDEKIDIDILDSTRDLGNREEFFKSLREKKTDALILTSTSILNGTTEEVLSNLAPGIPCVMLGPTTPMIPECYDHLPVTILAGTVPVDTEGVLKAIRHGKGTPVIQKSCKKVYVTL